MGYIHDLWAEEFEELSPPCQEAVRKFAKRLIQLVQKSEPAKFFTGRGKFVYAKYDLDLEKEIKDLVNISE